jgi:hypothetical protein
VGRSCVGERHRLSLLFTRAPTAGRMCRRQSSPPNGPHRSCANASSARLRRSAVLRNIRRVAIQRTLPNRVLLCPCRLLAWPSCRGAATALRDPSLRGFFRRGSQSPLFSSPGFFTRQSSPSSRAMSYLTGAGAIACGHEQLPCKIMNSCPKTALGEAWKKCVLMLFLSS